jgi:hypothetical protein
VRVSLQGTFDTLSVTDLFGLLATAAKTGALRLEAGDHEASVFLTGGLCCAVESDEATVPVASDGELATRLVDVGFAFARIPAGSFRFSDSELAAYDTGVTTPLEPAVAEIQSMLDQWREIEVTIPSLDVRVRLAPVLRDDEIVVTAGEWSLLVALEGTPTVRDLIARRHQPMMQVCRDLKGLVDRGAVEIGAEVVPAAAGRGESGHHGVDPSSSGHASRLLDHSEPYAPDADDLAASGSGAVAAAGAVLAAGADAIAAEADAATAEADAVAAGIVTRMTRSRRSVPDVFANGDDSAVGDGSPAGDVSVRADGVASTDVRMSGGAATAA